MDAPQWKGYATDHLFDPGEYVFREGDHGDVMYVIHEGRVAIIKEAYEGMPLVLGYRGAGELIGEISLIGDVPRSASVVAIEPTKLLLITLDDFRRMMADDASFGDYVMQTMVGQMRGADESRVAAAIAEHELFDRLSNLSTEHERLAELMQLRQETLHFIVHDLRNPLNTVMTALSMIELTGGQTATDKMGEFITLARSGVRRMLMLVDALLDVERLEEGSAALELEPVALPDLIEEIVERSRAYAHTLETTLRADLEPLPELQLDKQRIDRVLTNLVDNAVKFTPSGGQVTLETKQRGGWLMVSVNDSGVGVPPEQRERIFDRFVQAQTEGGEKMHRRGFGLGLAFCRSAVTAHGGTIWVEDGEGGTGSRFVFTLPVEPVEAVPQSW